MDRTYVRTFPLKVLWCVLDQEGKKSSHLQGCDGCMGEQCTLQKGCFYLFTFYLFTFLVIIQLYPFTISSTGPFSISEGEGHFFN